jgi:hypothetical protein
MLVGTLIGMVNSHFTYELKEIMFLWGLLYERLCPICSGTYYLLEESSFACVFLFRYGFQNFDATYDKSNKMFLVHLQVS